MGAAFLEAVLVTRAGHFGGWEGSSLVRRFCFCWRAPAAAEEGDLLAVAGPERLLDGLFWPLGEARELAAEEDMRVPRHFPA